MLKEVFPRAHERYSSLPVLGSILDGFLGWLVERGYTRRGVRLLIWKTRRVDQSLRRRSVRKLADVTREALLACVPRHSRDRTLSATVHALELYLDEQRLLPPLVAAQQSRTERQVALYKNYLEHERGIAPLTIGQHLRTARQLLEQIGYDDGSSSLCDLTASEIETFVVVLARQRSRRTMQQAVAQIRSFLRFLGARGQVKRGLDTEIDTPRVYRGERLPRALPWETVRAFLDSIDCTSALGLRDYAIFLLIATYGLRASEVVALTLDDIDWRGGSILIGQRKTVNPLLLPLTDDVGTCLVDYLRRGRPSLPWRELFLRTVAPAGVLTPKAVTHAFIRWSKRSGLEIPFHGPHCLRHSYAVHLLRQGTSLKTIGDILGHRSAESTQVYVRLGVDELREVALSLPRGSSRCSREEVKS